MFGFNNMCGWQPSLLLHDLTNGTQQGSMNLYMNQISADMQARQTLYMTPVMNWGSFSPYNTPGGSMSYLTDPSYTIGQWMWNNFANTGLNNLSGWGNMGMGNMGCNMGWGNMGWNGGAFPGAGNTTPVSNTNPANDPYASKYTRLLTLVKQIAKNGENLGLDPTQIEALQNASRATGKTNEEKYNNLKTAYNEALPDKSVVKQFLTTNAANNITVDGKETSATGSSVYKNLQDVGFEFSSSVVDEHIGNLYSIIDGLADGQGGWSSDDAIIGDLASTTSKFDILDVISSWNTYKKGADASSHEAHLMDFITFKYNNLKGDKAKATKEDFKTGVIKVFVDKLENRATKLMDKLEPADKDKIKEAIDELRNAYNKTGDTADSNLSKAFDNLYLMTRQAATEQLKNKIVSYYRDIDSDVFNDNLFIDDMKEDLKAEGFSDTQIDENKVTVKKTGTAVNPAPYVNSNDPLDKQIKDSTEYTEYTSTGINGASTVYKDNNTGKFYVVKDDDDEKESLHEITGVKVDNEKVVADGTPKVSDNAVEFKDVLKTSRDTKKAAEEKAQAAKEKEEKSKAEKDAVDEVIKDENILKHSRTLSNCPVYKEQSGNREFIFKPDGFLYELNGNKVGKRIDVAELKTQYAEKTKKEESYKASYADGKYVFDKIDGISDSKYYSTVNDKLAAVDKDNVLGFVQGFYDQKSSLNPEGMIEQLDDEFDGGKITMDAKKNLINSFLEKAKELGFKNDEDYKAIEEILSFYESGKEYENANNFNQRNGGILDSMGLAGTAAGGAAGMAALAAASGPVGWVAGAFVAACSALGGMLDARTDNEVIDKCMQSLMKKMQEKCPNEFQA